MSRLGFADAGGANRFPRVSGDEPEHLATLEEGGQFSPRERG